MLWNVVVRSFEPSMIARRRPLPDRPAQHPPYIIPIESRRPRTLQKCVLELGMVALRLVEDGPHSVSWGIIQILRKSTLTAASGVLARVAQLCRQTRAKLRATS